MNGKIIMVFALALTGVAATAYWLGSRSIPAVSNTPQATQTERKVLYYRNPMGLPDTSTVPKQDAMGMDYVPVYADEERASSNVVISPDKVQKLGVTSEAVAMRVLGQNVRASARIAVDERRTYTIAPKFEGWVEALHVNATGQMVSKGQPLFEVYSPELVSAQREQELAVRGLAELKDADEEARTGMQRLAAASAARLRNWNIAPGDIVGAPDSERPHVVLRVPVSGVVLEKKAVAGMRFMPGDTLYQLADLSSVWIIADVPEQNIGALRLGSHARVSVEAYPGKVFNGQVDFIYPTLDSTTRTVSVRLALPNPNGLLKPAMFAQVELAAGGKTPVLAVPVSAVIDSGSRQTVLVQIIEGRYEPRAVRLGARGGDYVEVLDGVAEGERVVTSANFLIDAESNLKAALKGFGEHAAHGGKAPTTEHEGH